MWLQYDFGDGPVIDGAKTVLFVAWLAWARFRVVIPLRDRTAPSVFAALDRTFRILGGAPTYVLTDNEKTVTVSHVAGVPVRNQQTVDFARHYGVTVLTCQPADPASKGGVESSVKLAKADIVPKDTNLRAEYASFARAGGGLRGVHGRGQRPGAPGHEAQARGDARGGTVPAAPGPGHRAHGRVRAVADGPGEHPDGDVRERSVLGARVPARRDGCSSAATGSAPDEQVIVVHARHRRSGRGRPAPARPAREPGDR